MSERRLEQLETKIAHQEYTISQLNAVVIEQREQLDQLQAAIEALARRYLALAEQGGSGSVDDDVPPPHY